MVRKKKVGRRWESLLGYRKLRYLVGNVSYEEGQKVAVSYFYEFS